jgi:hypothetical protein
MCHDYYIRAQCGSQTVRRGAALLGLAERGHAAKAAKVGSHHTGSNLRMGNVSREKTKRSTLHMHHEHLRSRRVQLNSRRPRDLQRFAAKPMSQSWELVTNIPHCATDIHSDH